MTKSRVRLKRRQTEVSLTSTPRTSQESTSDPSLPWTPLPPPPPSPLLLPPLLPPATPSCSNRASFPCSREFICLSLFVCLSVCLSVRQSVCFCAFLSVSASLTTKEEAANTPPSRRLVTNTSVAKKQRADWCLHPSLYFRPRCRWKPFASSRDAERYKLVVEVEARFPPRVTTCAQSVGASNFQLPRTTRAHNNVQRHVQRRHQMGHPKPPTTQLENPLLGAAPKRARRSATPSKKTAPTAPESQETNRRRDVLLRIAKRHLPKGHRPPATKRSERPLKVDISRLCLQCGEAHQCHRKKG